MRPTQSNVKRWFHEQFDVMLTVDIYQFQRDALNIVKENEVNEITVVHLWLKHNSNTINFPVVKLRLVKEYDIAHTVEKT